MDWLLFSKYSIHGFTQFLLSLIIALYLFRVRRRSPATRILGLFFFAFTGAMFCEFMAFSLATSLSHYLGISQGGLLFASLVALMQFAYWYPENRHRRESRWALALSTLVAVGTVGAFCVVLIAMPQLEHWLLLASLAMMLNAAWIAILFARKTILFSREADADRPAWKQLLWPAGRPARALASFGVLTLLWFLLASSLTLESLGSISMEVMLSILTLGILLFLFSFVLIYLNNSSEPSSFAVKLVGISLVIVLMTVGDIGTYTVWRFSGVYREQRLAEVEQVRQMVEEGNWAAVPSGLAFVDAYELREGKEGKRELFAREGFARNAFHREFVEEWFTAQVIRLVAEGLDPEQAEIEVMRGFKRATLIQLQQRYRVGGLVTEQLKYSLFYFRRGEELYLVFYPCADYARYMHAEARMFILFTLSSTLFILLVFPLFFRSSMLRPLQALLAGVERVNAGDLEVKVGVGSEDEMGYLTRSFNGMVRSIREKNGQLEEYSRNLEERVEERTRDLQAKNGELEEALRVLRETQERLLLQEKMASLGSLVAGVAHEINNPVGAINGAADVVERCVGRLEQELREADSIEGMRESRKVDQALELLRRNDRVILQAGGRIGRLVESLKSFARLDQAEFQLADVHEGIESALNLLQLQIGEEVEVVRLYGPVEPLHCSPGQLNQAFMNVLKNAAQAIDGEGRIEIRTRQEDGYVWIEIGDTGKGIPPERLRRIFDFGFSRGETRVRMGTGLSVAYQVVREHRGRIEIESEPGEGTRVRIALPVRKGRGTEG